MAKPPLCYYPFFGLSDNTKGYWQACCQAKPFENKDGNQKYNIKDISFFEFFNSKEMKQLRYDMVMMNESSDLYQKTCKNCIDEERMGVLSMRGQMTDAPVKQGPMQVRPSKGLFRHNLFEDIKQNPDSNLLPTDIKYLKIHFFGNLCNLKCISCQPMSSSKIAAEHIKWKNAGQWPNWEEGGSVLNKELYFHMTERAIINPYNNINKKKFYDELEESLTTIRMLDFVGGEPMYNKQIKELLEWIVSKELSKGLMIKFTTNAMYEDYELYNLLKYFKSTSVDISLDGVGKKDEYLRTGTVWKEKIEIIDNIYQTFSQISWSNTIQLCNIGYLDEMWKFIEQWKEKYPRKGVKWKGEEYGVGPLNNILSWPPILQGVNIPKKVAYMYIKKYEGKKFPRKTEFMNMLQNDKERNHDLFLRGMARYKFYDKKRGTCLLDQWPEFTEWYNEDFNSIMGEQIF